MHICMHKTGAQLFLARKKTSPHKLIYIHFMHDKSQQFSLYCHSLNYLVTKLLPWLGNHLKSSPLGFREQGFEAIFKR